MAKKLPKVKSSRLPRVKSLKAVVQETGEVVIVTKILYPGSGVATVRTVVAPKR